MVLIDDLETLKVSGMLPFLDNDKLVSVLGPKTGYCWIFEAGRPKREMYRLVPMFTAGHTSGVLFSPRDSSGPGPYSLTCSDFLERVYNVCRRPTHPSSPYTLQFNFSPSRLGLSAASCAQLLADVELNSKRELDDRLRFELKLGGKVDPYSTRGFVHAICRPAEPDPWSESLVRVELHAGAGMGILTQMARFLWKLFPRFQEAALTEPWDLQTLLAFDRVRELPESMEPKHFVYATSAGFEISAAPVPFWLRPPRLPRIDVAGGALMNLADASARPFTVTFTPKGRDNRPALWGIWKA